MAHTCINCHNFLHDWGFACNMRWGSVAHVLLRWLQASKDQSTGGARVWQPSARLNCFSHQCTFFIFLLYITLFFGTITYHRMCPILEKLVVVVAVEVSRKWHSYRICQQKQSWTLFTEQLACFKQPVRHGPCIGFPHYCPSIYFKLASGGYWSRPSGCCFRRGQRQNSWRCSVW